MTGSDLKTCEMCVSVLRFSQHTISPHLRSGQAIDDVAMDVIAAGKWHLPPLKVVLHRGKFWSMDNRRLAIAHWLRQAGWMEKVPTTLVAKGTQWKKKFSTKCDGSFIHCKVNGARHVIGRWRNTLPNAGVEGGCRFNYIEPVWVIPRKERKRLERLRSLPRRRKACRSATSSTPDRQRAPPDLPLGRAYSPATELPSPVEQRHRQPPHQRVGGLSAYSDSQPVPL